MIRWEGKPSKMELWWWRRHSISSLAPLTGKLNPIRALKQISGCCIWVSGCALPVSHDPVSHDPVVAPESREPELQHHKNSVLFRLQNPPKPPAGSLQRTCWICPFGRFFFFSGRCVGIMFGDAVYRGKVSPAKTHSGAPHPHPALSRVSDSEINLVFSKMHSLDFFS